MNGPKRSEMTFSSKRLKRSRARAKRGEGVIYDVIDEWLAPALACWIASTKRPKRKTSG
jgi:hypothetical protein